MGRARQHALFWLAILVASAGAGYVYDRVTDFGEPLVAAIHGLFIGAAVLAFETGHLLPRLQRRIRRLPTLAAVLAGEVTYVVLICAGFALAGVLVWAAGWTALSLRAAALPSGKVLLYALVVSAVLVSVIRVRDLIGREVFLSLLVGRYHTPVREERVFLFLDVTGSTRFAESLGDLKAQQFLGAFFKAIADPVRAHWGSIDDYVGDMAIVTWPLARGIGEGRCVACVFAIEDAIAREGAEWERSFGRVPRFRAALHAGPVVTAEVGVDRHKIAYFGDTVNMTGRLEALSKSLGVPVLISLDLLDRIPALPPGIVAEPLGEHAVRGRDRPIAVAALRRGSESMRGAAPERALARA